MGGSRSTSGDPWLLVVVAVEEKLAWLDFRRVRIGLWLIQGRAASAGLVPFRSSIEAPCLRRVFTVHLFREFPPALRR